MGRFRLKKIFISEPLFLPDSDSLSVSPLISESSSQHNSGMEIDIASDEEMSHLDQEDAMAVGSITSAPHGEVISSSIGGYVSPAIQM